MNHVADYRTGSDDRYLHDDVVKLPGPQSRKTRHLRAALYLEQPDRVRPAKRVINCRIVLREMGEIDLLAVVIADQNQAFLDRRHHSKPEQIHFDDPHIRTVFLVPLNNDPPGHRRRFERHNRIKMSLTDHHSTPVLPEMSRAVLT